MTPEDVAQINASFRAFAEAVLPALRRFGEDLAAAGRVITEITDEAYRDAGMPFGDSDEGKWRWLRERAQAEQLRAEADEIESWHQALVLIREKRAS